MDERETINTIALTRIKFYNLAGLLELYRKAGSASAILEHHDNIQDILPDASPRLVEALRDIDEPLKRAEVELEYNRQNGIQTLCLNDPLYPQRMKECADAPLVLYYKGNVPLNQKRVINLVGTRQCTMYGQDLIRHFVADMKRLCPDVLIVSGLAYGVDINAHRNALENGLNTIGVVAHGLDTIYPGSHRKDAERMTQHGGVLTEFMTMTQPFGKNFIQRNRIIAGMSDATILVESAAHGGGLVTARIARDYDRDVFAFPGAVGAKYSEGCNNIIRDNVAGLITSASDFMKAMGWEEAIQLEEAQKNGIERDMFPNLNADEQKIVNTLTANNDLQINMLAIQAGIPIGKLTSTLFQMEMKGILKQYAGGTYHLL